MPRLLLAGAHRAWHSSLLWASDVCKVCVSVSPASESEHSTRQTKKASLNRTWMKWNKAKDESKFKKKDKLCNFCMHTFFFSSAAFYSKNKKFGWVSNLKKIWNSCAVFLRFGWHCCEIFSFSRVVALWDLWLKEFSNPFRKKAASRSRLSARTPYKQTRPSKDTFLAHHTLYNVWFSLHPLEYTRFWLFTTYFRKNRCVSIVA
jgi:hypothetical protein